MKNESYESFEAVTHIHVYLANRKGITLVSLIITIIVMVILAGIALVMIIGEDGIISKVEDAKEKTESARQKEEEDLIKLGNYGKGITASMIKADSYGKVVTNYTEGEQIWEILFADNENIYLITKNVVADPKCNSKKFITEMTTEYYYGSTLLNLEGAEQKYPAVDKWFVGWKNSETNSMLANVGATLFMLDSTVWNGTYKNEYAEYVIGSPTLELLCASYNKMYNTNYIIEPLYLGGRKGYNYTIESGIEQGTVLNHAESYWLAAPDVSHAQKVCYVSKNSFKISGENNAFPIGFRPVVCLKSSVELIPDETKVDGAKVSYKIK